MTGPTTGSPSFALWKNSSVARAISKGPSPRESICPSSARVLERGLLKGAYFLGCRFLDWDTEKLLAEKGAILMPRFEGLAYDPTVITSIQWRS